MQHLCRLDGNPLALAPRVKKEETAWRAATHKSTWFPVLCPFLGLHRSHIIKGLYLCFASLLITGCVWRLTRWTWPYIYPLPLPTTVPPPFSPDNYSPKPPVAPTAHPSVNIPQPSIHPFFTWPSHSPITLSTPTYDRFTLIAAPTTQFGYRHPTALLIHPPRRTPAPLHYPAAADPRGTISGK